MVDSPIHLGLMKRFEFTWLGHRFILISNKMLDPFAFGYWFAHERARTKVDYMPFSKWTIVCQDYFKFWMKEME